MKTYTMTVVLFLMTMAYSLPGMANAANSFNGWMQGYNCVTHGHICPLDSADPHIAMEPDFVLYLDKGDYLLLPNIDRAVKAKYLHKPIRVTGNMNPRYKSIDVKTLEVQDGEIYKTVWSKKMMLEELKKMQEEMYGNGGG
ncbi:MAG: hypothetical protein WBB19_00430 [Desulforhopalus sp.]